MPEAPSPSTALTLRDLRVCPDGEARVTDIRLGQALGFQRVRKVRDLIKANTVELETHGTLPQIGAKSTGGRPSSLFLLNEPQAILITMFAQTAQAAQARKNIIQIYMAHRQGSPRQIERRNGQTHDTRAIFAGKQLANRLVSQKKQLADAVWRIHRLHGFDVLKADMAAVLAFGIRRNEAPELA